MIRGLLFFVCFIFCLGNAKAQVSASQINQMLNLGLNPNDLMRQINSTRSLQSLGSGNSYNASSYLNKDGDEGGEKVGKVEDVELSNEVLLQMLDQLQHGQDSLSQMLEEEKKDSLIDPHFNPNFIFGHHYFNKNKLALFLRSLDSKAPDDYILDSGDELNISVWGYSDYNGTFKVKQDGYISIPEFGRIYLRGISIAGATDLIKKRIRQFINLKTSRVEVALNYSRTITINIVGSVREPGTYVIPAINSVYNALNAADGVSGMGSLRNIEVRRGGKTVKTFDLYEFLTTGKTEEEFFLKEGDFIYVPIAEKIVKIDGQVRRPMHYELLEDENLADLLKYAGGLMASAYTNVIQVKRFGDNKVEIMDVKLADLIMRNESFKLFEGDQIYIPKIPQDYHNFIEVEGSVRVPGRYEFIEGYRISDLIKLADGVLDNAYQDRAYITRTIEDLTTVIKPIELKDILANDKSPDNLLLKRYDKLEVFSKRDFLEKFSVSVAGSVLRPVVKEFSEGLTLNDMIFYAGGLKKEAANNKIEISRVKNIDEEEGDSEPTRVIVKTIYVDNNLEIDDQSKAFLLKPMDQIFVRKTYEFDEQNNVTLAGEVKYPGVYPILQKNERLLDLIERAGGLTPYAHTEAATLDRPDKRIGSVILDLKEAYKDPESRANYILKPNDIINVPSINQLVSLTGAIRYPEIDTFGAISGKYELGKRAKFYVKKYGAGFDKRAKKTSTVVLNPNGSAGYTKKFPWFGRYPQVGEGATVSIDYKEKKEKKEKLPRDPVNWNILLPSLITSVTAAASSITTVLLVTRN